MHIEVNMHQKLPLIFVSQASPGGLACERTDRFAQQIVDVSERALDAGTLYRVSRRIPNRTSSVFSRTHKSDLIRRKLLGGRLGFLEQHGHPSWSTNPQLIRNHLGGGIVQNRFSFPIHILVFEKEILIPVAD